MRHAIDDVIESDAKGHRGKSLRVIRVVGPLPCVAQVHVVANGDDDAALVVADGAPFRLIAVLLIGAAAPHILLAGYLHLVVDVVERVKYLVAALQVYVDSGNDAGQFDQELFLAIRDWEPFFSANMEDDDDDTHDGPLLEKPAAMNTEPDGLEVNSMTYSINDKALGSGDPIRVKEGEVLLVHFLNASAIENRRIALAGHKMKVVAMDGNPVPTPQLVDSLFLGAGERIDAEIEMKNPGIWILGATEQPIREAGLGVIVEYAGQHTAPRWIDPPKQRWDYTIFGTAGSKPGTIGGGAVLWSRDRRFHRGPAGAGAVSLPHPAAYGLRVQGADAVCVRRSRIDLLCAGASHSGLPDLLSLSKRCGPGGPHYSRPETGATS